MSPDGAGTLPHPLVAQTFAALDDAGVGWVLRSGDVTLASHGPLQLTVNRADAPGLGNVLAEIGFAPVPSDGGGRRFLRYDEGSDRWLQLAGGVWLILFGLSVHAAA